MNNKDAEKSPCESCSRYMYDEETGEWTCLAELDEDELYLLLSGQTNECRCFRADDDYDLSKRQARPF